MGTIIIQCLSTYMCHVRSLMLHTRDHHIVWNTPRSGKILCIAENTYSMCQIMNLSVGFLVYLPFFPSRDFASFVTTLESLPENSVQIEKFTPFIYIDISDRLNAVLYIQPLPLTYNVTEYKVWLISNDTKSTLTTIVPANEDHGHIRLNLLAPDGVYYVKVAALHPECGEHGCANSTSPYVHISKCDLAQNFLFLISPLPCKRFCSIYLT